MNILYFNQNQEVPTDSSLKNDEMSNYMARARQIAKFDENE